jgi:hypothetical protein
VIWRDKLSMSTLGRGAALLLAGVLVAGVVIWRTAGRAAAQETGSKTVSGAASPPGAPGIPGKSGAAGARGPGSRFSTPGTQPAVEVSPATPIAVPQGTEMSSEEFRRLKEQAAGTPGPAGSSVQQDPAAGPAR